MRVTAAHLATAAAAGALYLWLRRRKNKRRPVCRVDGCDVYGATPLSIACQRGHAACASALLDAGADPNRRRAGGLTPLSYAALEGHAQCVIALRTAAVDGADCGGSTHGVGSADDACACACWLPSS